MTTPNIWRKKVDNMLSTLDHAKRRLEEERTALVDAQNRLDAAEQAQQIVQGISQQVQQQAHDRIASVVSHCLAAVFEDDAYRFKIIFEKKRGRTEARMVFLKGAHELDPTTASGIGAVDVAALAARVACLKMARPRIRQLLVLDEPLRNVHGDEFQARAGEMVMSLAKDMGVQLVVVTDDDWLKIGKVISF